MPKGAGALSRDTAVMLARAAAVAKPGPQPVLNYFFPQVMQRVRVVVVEPVTDLEIYCAVCGHDFIETKEGKITCPQAMLHGLYRRGIRKWGE